jgi:hypothetical protein
MVQLSSGNGSPRKRKSRSEIPQCTIADVTRYVKPTVERELWGRAAARCEFPDCNRLLYLSPVTQERVNLAEKAHIYSFSVDGPRGRGPMANDPALLNETSNLLLVCQHCHSLIDQDKTGARYSAELLQRWKKEHESRIVRVTGIAPTRKSHVILYGSRIGEQESRLHPGTAMDAMFPDAFPATDAPFCLAMKCEHEDVDAHFWDTEARHLRTIFRRNVQPMLADSPVNHVSVFGLANMPLLTLLGALLTDKTPADVYQLRREPTTWRWQDDCPDDFEFLLNHPVEKSGVPALVLSLSARIGAERVTAVLRDKVALWELTVAEPHNDFLRSRAQLSKFRAAVRKTMVAINAAHGNATPLHIFPAMPVACAVELGRVRMPKADMPWVIYDQNAKLNSFHKAITIDAAL